MSLFNIYRTSLLFKSHCISYNGRNESSSISSLREHQVLLAVLARIDVRGVIVTAETLHAVPPTVCLSRMDGTAESGRPELNHVDSEGYLRDTF